MLGIILFGVYIVVPLFMEASSLGVAQILLLLAFFITHHHHPPCEETRFQILSVSKTSI